MIGNWVLELLLKKEVLASHPDSWKNEFVKKALFSRGFKHLCLKKGYVIGFQSENLFGGQYAHTYTTHH